LIGGGYQATVATTANHPYSTGHMESSVLETELLTKTNERMKFTAGISVRLVRMIKVVTIGNHSEFSSER